MAGLGAKKVLTPNDPELGSLAFNLAVPYSSDIGEAAARGAYTSVDPSVLKYFECGRMQPRRVKVRMLHFERLVHAKWLCANMAGMRVADIEELLAFGAQYPDVQRRFPIVALGSMCKIGQSPGVWNTPHLIGNEKERRLSLGACNFHWGDAFRFLVISLPGWDEAGYVEDGDFVPWSDEEVRIPLS